MKTTDLSSYDNAWFAADIKASGLKRICWYFVNTFCFDNHWFPFSSLKVFWLRLFGARIGDHVVIKPCVNIKYPWKLTIGDQSWIGEGVWIDNLTEVRIGSNVCLSQGVMLLTGNHNYKRASFDLTVSPITIENGVWLGAKSIVCPGVTVQSHAVLVVGSVASHDLDAYTIYQGNPAAAVRTRTIE